MKKIFVFLFVFITQQARAQIFQAEVIDYGGLESFPLVKSIIDEQVKKIQDDINEEIPNGSPGRIMRGMSNASVLAGKGTTSDYSSHMEKYLFGIALGGAADLERPTGTNSDLSGVGVAPSAVIGANLGNLGVENFAGLDPKRLNVYLSYLQYGRYESLDPFIGMDSELAIRTKTLGFRMNYDWVEPKEFRHHTWGGLKLTWGYSYNETQFDFEHDLDITFDVNDTQTIRGKITGRPKYVIDVITQSIPFEISTDVTFFKFLTLFGGAGLDFNYGVARGHAKGNGDVSPLLCTDGVAICGGGRFIQLQVQGTAEAQGRVEPVTARGFLGLQINVPYFQLYGMINKPVGNEILGGGVGIRFVR